jgi:hypothetical protein
MEESDPGGLDSLSATYLLRRETHNESMNVRKKFFWCMVSPMFNRVFFSLTRLVFSFMASRSLRTSTSIQRKSLTSLLEQRKRVHVESHSRSSLLSTNHPSTLLPIGVGTDVDNETKEKERKIIAKPIIQKHISNPKPTKHLLAYKLLTDQAKQNNVHHTKLLESLEYDDKSVTHTTATKNIPPINVKKRKRKDDNGFDVDNLSDDDYSGSDSDSDSESDEDEEEYEEKESSASSSSSSSSSLSLSSTCPSNQRKTKKKTAVRNATHAIDTHIRNHNELRYRLFLHVQEW